MFPRTAAGGKVSSQKAAWPLHGEGRRGRGGTLPFGDLGQQGIEVRLEDRFVDLVEEGIDVALRISAAQDSSLIARKICDMQHSVVAAPVYLDAHGTPKAPEDLRNHAVIVDNNLQGQANWRFVDNGQTISVH